MKPRVCILRMANPFGWSEHYTKAFRRQCDVITVGPRMSSGLVTAFDRDNVADYVKPNDIETDLNGDVALDQLLPEGWYPDLIVAISELGIPLCPRMHRVMCPKAYISIDTWHCVRDYMDGLFYDFVFVAQRSFVEHLENAGCRNVYWLPLAASPDVHCPVEAPEKYDVAFVGSVTMPTHAGRYHLLKALKENFNLLTKDRLWKESFSAGFALGKLAFNHGGWHDVNMRVFECLSMGRPLLTNADADENGLFDLFEDGKHLIAYKDADDLIRKAGKYLEDTSARKTIGEQGRIEILAKHTYDHRAKQILETVMEKIPEMDITVEVNDDLLQFLPVPLGKTIDFGAALSESKHILHTLGLGSIIATIPDQSAPVVDESAYDSIVPWSERNSLSAEAETAIITDASMFSCKLHELVQTAFSGLRTGGALILCVRESELADEQLKLEPQCMIEWFWRHNFHLTEMTHSESSPCAVSQVKDISSILVARKRTHTLKEIFSEVFENVDVEDPQVKEYIASLPDLQ